MKFLVLVHIPIKSDINKFHFDIEIPIKIALCLIQLVIPFENSECLGNNQLHILKGLSFMSVLCSFTHDLAYILSLEMF